MSPRWPKRVEVDGGHEPLDIAGVVVSAGDPLDPRSMLQEHVHHIQRVAPVSYTHLDVYKRQVRI